MMRESCKTTFPFINAKTFFIASESLEAIIQVVTHSHFLDKNHNVGKSIKKVSYCSFEFSINQIIHINTGKEFGEKSQNVTKGEKVGKVCLHSS